jgi:AcrR family transcriptional regulator
MGDVKTAAGQTRRARARATQNRIIDHAYRLFCASGYPGTTMEAIAAKAGVATQTVYCFFRTKALLLQQVVEVVAAVQAHPLTVMDPSMPESPWVPVHETLGAEATAAPLLAVCVPMFRPEPSAKALAPPAHAGAESPSTR